MPAGNSGEAVADLTAEKRAKPLNLTVPQTSLCGGASEGISDSVSPFLRLVG